MLDTRTGIVPFTAVFTREVQTERMEKEFASGEAMNRAMLDASLAGIQALGSDLGTFLKAVPQAVPTIADPPLRPGSGVYIGR